MKPSILVLIAVLTLDLAACRRGSEREQKADAAPPPSSTVASAELAAPDVSSAPQPEEAGAELVADAPTDASHSSKRATERPASPRGDEISVAALAAPEPQPPADDQLEETVVAEEAPTVVVEKAEPEPIVLPAGTGLAVRLEQTLASDLSEPKERVTATLSEDVSVDGRVALPAASEVIGHVVVARRSGRVKGKARLVVAFDRIRVRGKSYAIDAPRWDISGASTRERDAKIAGGAAAVGAIIGGIKGGGKGALKGGAIGGAAGGAAVLATRGNEVRLPAGSELKITLRQPLRIE